LQHNRIVRFSRIGAAANKSENSTCATSIPSIISFPAASELLLQSPASQKDLGKRMGIRALRRRRAAARRRVVPDYSQVICPACRRSIGWRTGRSPEARISNDGLAELVAKHPDHFVGCAAIAPPNAAGRRSKVGGSCRTAPMPSRCTPMSTAPYRSGSILPIYEIIEKSGKPILPHPIRTREMADYRSETKSNTRFAA
jgi:hypothetical protein